MFALLFFWCTLVLCRLVYLYAANNSKDDCRKSITVSQILQIKLGKIYVHYLHLILKQKSPMNDRLIVLQRWLNKMFSPSFQVQKYVWHVTDVHTHGACT